MGAWDFIIFIWKLHQVHFVFLLIVLALCLFFLSLVGFNIYCWKGIHFSWSNFLIFLYLFLHLVCSFHFWFRDLLREFAKNMKSYYWSSFLFFFFFLLLKLCYLYPSFGHLFILYLLQLAAFVLEKVSIFQILVN